MLYSKRYPDFTTITCLEWKSVLADNFLKDIIIESMRFLTNNGRVTIYGFVFQTIIFIWIGKWWGIMNWKVQSGFLFKYRAKDLNWREELYLALLSELVVNAKDRKRQVWERNSLSVPLWTQDILIQKLSYINDNPVRAGLWRTRKRISIEVRDFMFAMKRDWDFLVHYNGYAGMFVWSV